MRVSRQEMKKSYGRILERAAALIRKRGIEGTSVADVMSAAELTHGGFYRHFESKEALVAAALEVAFKDLIADLNKRFEHNDPPAAIAGFQAHYLSRGHVEHPDAGCPIAALGTEVAREENQLKTKFGEGVNRVIDSMARGMPGTTRQKRDRAMRELAMLAGAVIIARASDPETAGEVLAACRSDPDGHSL